MKTKTMRKKSKKKSDKKKPTGKCPLKKDNCDGCTPYCDHNPIIP
jgi:hypothetical protein